MEVMDAPYRAGDLRHGYQAVADNLPNDPRIHQEKGTKKIFFKNFMDARVDDVILPIAQVLMQPDQAAKASAEGYLASTLMHEISHELGPDFARANGKQVDIREAIGPAYSGLEEAKADVVGMFGLKWLVDHGALPKERLQEYYASYVAGIFRTLRFGTGEAHGRAEMMEFNYLANSGALTHDGRRYTIDYEPHSRGARGACEGTARNGSHRRSRPRRSLVREVRQDAGRLGDHAFGQFTDIPVDIDPVFSFPDPFASLPGLPGMSRSVHMEKQTARLSEPCSVLPRIPLFRFAGVAGQFRVVAGRVSAWHRLRFGVGRTARLRHADPGLSCPPISPDGPRPADPPGDAASAGTASAPELCPRIAEFTPRNSSACDLPETMNCPLRATRKSRMARRLKAASRTGSPTTCAVSYER